MSDVHHKVQTFQLQDLNQDNWVEKEGKIRKREEGRKRNGERKREFLNGKGLVVLSCA